MNKKIHSLMMLALLLTSIVALAFDIQLVKAEPKTWTVDDDGVADFSSIQEAIDSPVVRDGDEIFVNSGTYLEHIVVNKSLTFIGEDPNTTIIIGIGNHAAWDVLASHVTIKEFTIKRDVYEPPIFHGMGISLYSSFNIIEGNVIDGHGTGIWLTRWGPEGPAQGNIIVGNIIINNGDGIECDENCNDNVINRNKMTDNYYGISFYYSSKNRVSDNNIVSKQRGILLYESSNSSISGNNITTENEYGIILSYSSNNSISGNHVANNHYGVWLSKSSENMIFHNNFVKNEYQVYVSFRYTNLWDDGYPSGGNYWSDYEEKYPDAQELDGSGIWDTPYLIDADNQDNYPLMEPWTPVPEDTTPPVTTISFDGTMGNNGWYTSDVTVTLSATDDISGVDRTEYSFDNSTWSIYDASFVVTTEGVTAVYYRSIDAAGNVETTKSGSTKIDKTAPAITVTLSAPAYGVAYTQADTLTITYTSTDPISGSASASATLDSNPISNGESISLLWFSLGSHTIVVTATDNAGNTAQEVVTFEVVATLDGLEATIDQLNSHGLIDNQGIVTSFVAKLDAAQKLVQSDGPTTAAKNILNAFINEVQAQSGKHITPEATDILIESAEHIISNL